jgi:hypothetical protein
MATSDKGEQMSYSQRQLQELLAHAERQVKLAKGNPTLVAVMQRRVDFYRAALEGK